MRLEDYLAQDAHLYPDKTAVICGDTIMTYKELYSAVCKRSQDYSQKGLPAGFPFVFRSSQDIDFLITYLSIHQSGHVAVPLASTVPDSTYQSILSNLEDLSLPSGTADILYTTGTTGKSKGVIISHRTIVSNGENLIDGQGFSHDLAFVVNGPLNHIGSLSKLYPIIMLGATLIIVDGLKDINRFLDAMDYPCQKTATFLVPASIRYLIHFASSKLSELSHKIDFIETGASAISHGDMQMLCRLLPKSRLYNTYASTETGIISTYNFNDGQCIPMCLGKPMKHSHIHINESGHIVCSGNTLMSGYAGDVALTYSVLQKGCITTSDLGYLDDEGMLHLEGRSDDIINVGGYKINPLDVEDVAMGYPGIKDCICIPTFHPILFTALKLLIVSSEGCSINKRDLALYLKERMEGYKVPSIIESVASIHRTYNGKLDRKKYKDAFLREEEERSKLC